MLDRKKGVNQGNGLYGRRFNGLFFFDIKSQRSEMKQFTQINGYLKYRLFTSKALKYISLYINGRKSDSHLIKAA